MTESDLDNELEGLLGDEEAAGDDSEDVSLDGDLAAMLDDSDATAEEGGGAEDVGLDDDLAAMLDDSEAGESAEAAGDGESVGLDDELSGMLGDSASDEGGEGVTLDDDLAALTGGGGGAAASAAAPAPPPAPAKPSTANLTERQAVNLDFLLDIKLDVTFEVGRSKMLISDLLSLGQGSVIELHRLVGDELDLLVNGKLIAKGEVIVVNEKFGCKISEIVSPEDRVNYIAGL